MKTKPPQYPRYRGGLNIHRFPRLAIADLPADREGGRRPTPRSLDEQLALDQLAVAVLAGDDGAGR